MAFRPVIPGGPRYAQPQGLDFRPLERGIEAGINRNALLEKRAIDEQRYADDQAYKNKLLEIKQAEAARGGLPWWAGQDGSVHPAMLAKLKASPNMGFAPIVIDGAMVSRGGATGPAGKEIYRAPPSPAEEMMRRYLNQQQPGGPGAAIPQSANEAPFAEGGVVTPAGFQPVSDVQTTPVSQPAAPETIPGQGLTDDQLSVMLTDPKTKAFAQSIIDRRAAGEAGQVFTKATTTQIQKDTLAAQGNLENLYSIKAAFKPEYQNRLNKFWMSGIRMADAWGLATPEQQALLTEFTNYRTESYRGLNEYIKSITGAAMSNEEAKRIQKGFIDPGDNPWEGDTPTEAKAKIDNAIQQSQLAMARLNYLRKRGKFPENADPAQLGEIAAKKMPLGRMRNMIQKDFNRFRKEAIKNGLSDQDADRYADQRTSQEYGI